MTLPNRLWSWIVNSTKRKARVLLIRASAARSAAGRPAKKTDGVASADTNGTRSILEACAPRAYTNGLRHSASRALAGRHTQNGTCSNTFTSGSKPHTAAKAETTGFARACRRAFDSQPRGRSRSAVWCLARRRCALATRFRKWSVQRPFQYLTDQHAKHAFFDAGELMHAVASVSGREPKTQTTEVGEGKLQLVMR
jgi:hypothetical protein